MRIVSTSIFVNDQQKALDFYTEKLGFVVKNDIPLGEFRWLTLVSQDEASGTELVLEPNAHPAAKEYQTKMYEDGIPLNMFGVVNLTKTFEDLHQKGVKFHTEPVTMDDYKYAVIDDTCGNLIQLLELR